MWNALSQTGQHSSFAAHEVGDFASPYERILLRAVDVGLASVVCLAPLFMGGRYPLGRFVFVALVCMTTIAWLCRQYVARESTWRWSGAEWLLGATALLLIAQITSLPPTLLARLSPAVGELLPTWTSQPPIESGWGLWSTISLTPLETRSGLVTFLAYSMLFWVVVQRIGKVGDVERLLRLIAIAATAMAVLGISQQLFGNGKFLWFYEHPFRHTNNAVKGTFINENHFAHFLALGVAPLLWWLQASSPLGGHVNEPTSRNGVRPAVRDQGRLRLVLATCLTAVALAGLLTFSRGGVIVILVAAALSGAMYAHAGLLRRRTVATFVGVATCVAAAVMIYGYEPLSAEMSTLGAGSIETVDTDGLRRKLWAADLTAVTDFPWFGTGVGSHREIYQSYFQHPVVVEFTHAENGYLQVLLETGTLGFLLLLAGLALIASWCARALWRAPSARHAACAIAIAVAVVISLLHSLWDFVWYLPACMSLTVILIACACRLQQLAPETDHGQVRRIVVPRIAWGMACLIAVALSTTMINNRLGPARAARHWEAYLRQTVALRRHRAAEDFNPSDVDQRVAKMIEHLEKTVATDPNHARAQSRLANLYVRQFNHQQKQPQALNPLPLSQLRDAAMASRFPSRSAQDEWLAIAIGENRRYLELALEHAKCALHLCPLQGNSYLDLAEVAFLDGHGEAARSAYVAQALKVRPYNGDVLLAAGVAAALQDDVDQAATLWQAAIRQDPRLEQRLVAVLGRMLPVTEILERFGLRSSGLRSLYRQHREAGNVEEAQVAARFLVQALEQAAREDGAANVAALWEQAGDVHEFLGDEAASLAAVARASSASPDDYRLRSRFGRQLLKQGECERALAEFTWCQRRKPGDAQVNDAAARARERIAGRVPIHNRSERAVRQR